MVVLAAEQQATQLRGVALLSALCALVLFAAAAQAPAPDSGQAGDVQVRSVLTRVGSYVNTHRADDPLVSLDGVEAKSSNIYGIEVDGVRYYYRILRHASFDPLSRGTVAQSETIGVLHPGTEWEVAVYWEAGQ